ncbi:MAG TPA: hypothetical protein VIU62_16780 [Chloroflexota bacterium]
MLRNEHKAAAAKLPVRHPRRVRQPATPASANLTRLRRSVLHLGSLLGWSQEEILVFVEAVTGAPWERCASEELLAVVGEYRDIMQVIAVRLARQRARDLHQEREEDEEDGENR